jgi:type IV pilus assembly protein PilZ
MADAAGGPSRLYPRYEVEIWVDFTTLDLVTSSYVLNLSEGGVFIKSDGPLPLDAEVDLVLTLPTGNVISARGLVVWNHDLSKEAPQGVRGSGIRFVDMPSEDRALLHDYVHSLAGTAGERRGH